MTTLADFNAMVDTRIKDTDGILASADIDAAIAQAVQTYSKHRPQELVADIAGDGSYDYDLPSGWVSGFSVIRSVEYPAGDREPDMLEADEYRLYTNTSSTKLRFLADTPATGQTARVTYSAPHEVTVSSSTIPASDEDALADLSAAVACEWLSSHFSQQGDSTLSADTTEQSSKARDFALRASRFRQLAFAHLGIATKGGAEAVSTGVKAASATIEWDTDLSNNAGDRLTHPKRWR